jgi:hypothetical protein
VKNYFLRPINSLILFGKRKNFLRSGRNLLLYQFTRKAIKLTVIIIEAYHCYQLHTKLYPLLFSQGEIHAETKLSGNMALSFVITNQLLSRNFSFFRYLYWEKNWRTMNE